MSSYVEINSDPGAVIAKAGQLVTLASNYRGAIDPNISKLMQQIFQEPGCLGVDDKFSRMIKKGLSPAILDAMRQTAGARADNLDAIAVRLREAIASVQQEDIKHARQTEEIESGKA
jgi:hypothetical protein